MLTLLAVFAMAAIAMADAPTLTMELAQTEFFNPQEVTVTICIENPSAEDMPGPVALYWPDGKIIENFGTPTLAAGESRTWEGTWFVTEEQLQSGKVIFALRYATLDADGQQIMMTNTYYTAIERVQMPHLTLAGNPTTGYAWQAAVDAADILEVSLEYCADDTGLIGSGGRYEACFNGLTTGEASVTLTYRRPWEEEALYTLVYRVQVDEELNVTILSSSFDW